MGKRILLFILLLGMPPAFLPTAAQQRADSVYTFRFVLGKDMFYVPWKDNGPELARLLECIGRNRPAIAGGRVPLYIDGHCNSGRSEQASLAIARVRSSRVKSELIARKGLHESCFVTHNHADGGDFVTVRITLPKAEAAPADSARAGHKEADGRQRSKAGQTAGAAQGSAAAAAAAGQERQQPCAGAAKAARPDISLRANLLRWATLTPSLGAEWRFSPSWGVAVGGSWTSWQWNGKDRRYALWEVAPELRHYVGRERRGYIGAMAKAGQFNYKLSATGRQGSLAGGALTGGYLLRLGRSLSLDLSAGVGCIHADYDRYTVTGGVRVRQGGESKNCWGVSHLGATLVWNIF